MSDTAPAVHVTRTYRFSAAHYYWNAAFSEAENVRVFGKCANRNGHGHNYRLEVVVTGQPDPATGMLFDLRELDEIVRSAVLEPLDHRNLNHEVAWFATHQPTCENLARYIWNSLVSQLPGGRLAAVRVHEADDLAAECRG